MKQKTYRVPKRVSDSARTALALVEGVTLNPGVDIGIVRALAYGGPVGPDVPQAVDAFFASRPAGRMDVPDVMLHGGMIGRDWANRCVTLSIAPAKARKGTETFDDIFDMSESEYESLREFTKELAEAAGVKVDLEDNDTELAVQEPVAEEEPDDEQTPLEELEDQIETALGLATQLDDTVEKLADALDDALEETDDEEPADPEAEVAEMNMVHEALLEVGADIDGMDADFAVMAAEARERVAAVQLVRERSKAMARMASSRLTLANEAPGPVAEAIAEKVTEEVPKALGDHHAARQVRDWHGRFAKVGARVRSKDGNLGYVKKVDDQGQLVITGDDGNEHTVDPKEIEVVTAKAPAHLPEPLPLIDDPKARLATYLTWAKDQMGVKAA